MVDFFSFFMLNFVLKLPLVFAVAQKNKDCDCVVRERVDDTKEKRRKKKASIENQHKANDQNDSFEMR